MHACSKPGAINNTWPASRPCPFNEVARGAKTRRCARKGYTSRSADQQDSRTADQTSGTGDCRPADQTSGTGDRTADQQDRTADQRDRRPAGQQTSRTADQQDRRPVGQ